MLCCHRSLLRKYGELRSELQTTFNSVADARELSPSLEPRVTDI